MPSEPVLFSRVVVLALSPVVCGCGYLGARLSYWQLIVGKKYFHQFVLMSTLLGSIALQHRIMNRFAPNDAHGNFSFVVTVMECIGGLATLFTTLVKIEKRNPTPPTPEPLNITF